MNNSFSIFSQIINRTLPAEILFESDTVIIIKNIYPAAPIHWLAIPKLEVKTLNDFLQDSENQPLLWELFSGLKNLAENHNLHESGYRIVINNGKDGGQSIDHLHLHLLGGGKLDSTGV